MDGGEVGSEAGDGDGVEVGGGERAEDALGAGRNSAAVFGDGQDERVDLGVAGVVEERAIGGVGEERVVAGHLLFDGGDAVLTDAEGIVAAEGKVGATDVLVHVGKEHASDEACDLEGVGVMVLVGVAAEDPRLVERVHGAELGLAVDAEVEADSGVDFGAADLPLVLGVADGDEERAFGSGDADLRVDPEGHHDVVAFEVKVAEVGEVAGVGEDYVVAGGGEGLNELLGRRGFLAADFGGDGCGSLEGVEAYAVEDIGEALAFGVHGREGRVGAVAAYDTSAEVADDAFSREAGESGRMVEGDGLGLVEWVGAEVDELFGVPGLLWCGTDGSGGCAGVYDGLGCSVVFRGGLADDAHGGSDAGHGPSGEAVEVLPVFAEDEFAEALDERGGQQGWAAFAIAVEVGEEGIGEAGCGGELAHHLGEEDGVGRHGGFGDHVGLVASATEHGQQ